MPNSAFIIINGKPTCRHFTDRSLKWNATTEFDYTYAWYYQVLEFYKTISKRTVKHNPTFYRNQLFILHMLNNINILKKTGMENKENDKRYDTYLLFANISEKYVYEM